MAPSARPVKDATLLAIDEVNQQGGALGRRIEALVIDGQSNDSVVASELERILTTERVAAVFGCWTSSCRKTMIPILERHNGLLFYPLQYEGLEDSPQVVYTGSVPNQQIIPTLRWIFGNGGRRIFLVGSDYVFPHAANEIAKLQISKWRGEVTGERYIGLGCTDAGAIVDEIAATRPDAILNTINGTTNEAFFAALQAKGLGPHGTNPIPVYSFSVAEGSMDDPTLFESSYVAWHYLSDPDDDFVQHFRERYGAARHVNDPMESAYVSVYLFVNAVTAANSDDPDAVRRAVTNQSFAGPGGIVFVDENRHTWKTVRVGQLRPDGSVESLWAVGRPIPPAPYPAIRSKGEWVEFLDELSAQWGGQWSGPSCRGSVN